MSTSVVIPLPSPSHPPLILILIPIQVFGVQNSFSAAAKQIISQRTAQPDHPAKLISAASIVAFKPFALLSHYSASKWAVRGLTQAYAMEMAEHHITANAYAPGIVGTAMWDLIDEELGKKRGAQKGETIRKYSEELVSVRFFWSSEISTSIIPPSPHSPTLQCRM